MSLEGAYKEMEQLRKSLSEKEDLAQEEALIKETEARKALQEQLREQQDQHREETDRLLRYTPLLMHHSRKPILLGKCALLQVWYKP